MLFRLDHVVIAVRDLDKTIEDYRALGFTVQIGGSHPGRSSHNALVVFEDGAYLELIAWRGPDRGHRWYEDLQVHGDGCADFALLPENTAQAVSEAATRGLMLDGPIDGGRVRPDGKELKWQTARQSTFDLPFLCGDVTPREWRVPEGEGRKHENGSLGIATVVVAVHNLEASLARYRGLVGPLVPGMQKVASPAVATGTGIRLAVIRLAQTTIMLTTPSGAGGSTAARIVTDRLASRGEGPVALSILGGLGAQARMLDLALTHGVTIDIGPWLPAF